MTPNDYIHAARCPDDMPMGVFGLWEISRRYAASALERKVLGFGHQTRLKRMTMPIMRLDRTDWSYSDGWWCNNDNVSVPSRLETVMEDSIHELHQHLPIWLAARGRVLVTGLGLGCVVRGLLVNPDVEHIDCVEIDAHIVEIVGREFNGIDRVTIHHADALDCEWEPDKEWDYAWHDLWVEEGSLHALHHDLILKMRDYCRRQGAWSLSRIVKRILSDREIINVIG